MATMYGRPLWQWIILYLVLGLLVYGVSYYFFFAKKGPVNYGASQQTPTATQQVSPSVSEQSSKNAVEISNFAYSPATITIKAGEGITFTNKDTADHSATADDNNFDTGIISQGKSAMVTFGKPGTYPYHCSLHPNMHGTVIVQ